MHFHCTSDSHAYMLNHVVFSLNLSDQFLTKIMMDTHPAYMRLCTLPHGRSLESVAEYLRNQGHTICLIPKPKRSQLTSNTNVTEGEHLSQYELQISIQNRSATFGISDCDGNGRNIGERYAYVRGSHKILHIAASIFQHAVSLKDDHEQKEHPCNKPCQTKCDHVMMDAQSPPAYMGICTVPDGLTLDSIAKCLRSQGRAIRLIPKPQGDHLNQYELQIWIQSKSATFGITDWGDNGRNIGQQHAYVRGSHKILHTAASVFKDTISVIAQKEKHCACVDGCTPSWFVGGWICPAYYKQRQTGGAAKNIQQKAQPCNMPCEIKCEDCQGYCDYYTSQKHDTHQCDSCNPWKHLQ